MAKNSWNDYSATAANNSDVGNVNTSETMNPSDVNDAIRELMSHTADVVAGTVALSSINIQGGSVTGITDLAVADGGTGVSTLTANGVLFGNGTSAIGVTAVGTSGQVLTSNGSSPPTFQDAATTYTHPNHSGEVTSTGDGATVIASNVVDEDNLKVSNSPTDGYILTARSGNTGGLTWEAPAGGGATDIDGLSDAVTNSSGQTIGLGTGALVNDDGTSNDNTAIGYNAGYNITTGSQNFIGGHRAVLNLTTGANNTVVGYEALLTGTTSSDCVVIGRNAMQSSGSTDSCVAIGANAGTMGSGTTLGTGNICIGRSAGTFGPTGGYNTFIGFEAGQGINGSNISGFGNVGLGLRSMQDAKNAATGNTALGSYTLEIVDGGDYNTAVGYDAGDNITTGSNNTLIGNGADASSATVSNEITLGNTSITKFRIPGIDFVLKDNGGIPTTGQVLTADGSGEGYWATPAGGGATDIDGLSDAITNSSGATIGLGTGALVNDDGTANNNTALGYNALNTVTSGSSNTAIGHSALSSLTIAGNSTAVGFGANLYQTTGGSNTGVGWYTNVLNTTGESNTAVGAGANYLNTSSSHNTAVGSDANRGKTGANNTAVGSLALYDSGTGADNTSIGYRSLISSTNGNYNTALGSRSGQGLTTGSNNVFIGYSAGDDTTTGTNQIVIGDTADASTATVSNEITLGNSSISTLRCNQTTISSLSDRRDKTDIEDLPIGLDFIKSLRPVKFRWDRRDGTMANVKDAGFIAQELDEVQQDFNSEEYMKMVLKTNPEKLEAAPGKLIPVLVKAIQELSQEVERLKEGK